MIQNLSPAEEKGDFAVSWKPREIERGTQNQAKVAGKCNTAETEGTYSAVSPTQPYTPWARLHIQE